MIELQLERVNELTEKDVPGLEFSFSIDAEVAKPITQLENDLPFITSPLPERVKDFGFDEQELQGADGLTKVIFVLKAKNGRIYKKAGMVFAGYDEHLYRAFPESRGEIAVFFYALLDNE
ncbi:hypothetical protein MY1884_004145 [Beauveria asiatica]